MTVGSLFILIISLIVILSGVAYIFYRLEIKRLEKIGYRNLSEVVNYSGWLLISFLVSISIAAFGFLLYQVIVNWNTPI